MSEERIQVPAILDKLTTLKDNSLKLVFHTNEVSPSDAAALMMMSNSFGYLLFAPSRHREVSIPDLPGATAAPGKKSQSQRLRASLYRLWESKGQSGDFETFYKRRMEHLIGWVQEQIDGDTGVSDDGCSTG